MDPSPQKQQNFACQETFPVKRLITELQKIIKGSLLSQILFLPEFKPKLQVVYVKTYYPSQTRQSGPDTRRSDDQFTIYKPGKQIQNTMQTPAAINQVHTASVVASIQIRSRILKPTFLGHIPHCAKCSLP